jgi:hypothetical protein
VSDDGADSSIAHSVGTRGEIESFPAHCAKLGEKGQAEACPSVPPIALLAG